MYELTGRNYRQLKYELGQSESEPSGLEELSDSSQSIPSDHDDSEDSEGDGRV